MYVAADETKTDYDLGESQTAHCVVGHSSSKKNEWKGFGMRQTCGKDKE